MPNFNQRSIDNLKTCDFLLQNLFNEVIQRIDCSVICGHRGKEEQNEAFDKKASKVRYPDSKHNSFPSMAVDVYPYPYDWEAGRWSIEKLVDEMRVYSIDHEAGASMLARVLKNMQDFYFFGGMVKGIAWELGIKVTWGGEWSWKDLPHWQVKK